MKIKVLSTPKKIMYILGDCIRISYGNLWSLSDDALQAAIYHELGHRQNLSRILLVNIFFSIFVSVLLIITPFVFYPILLFFSYLVYCFLIRQGEYLADKFAAGLVSKAAMIEFLISMNHDCSRVFYLFRFHPSNRNRKKKLNKFYGR